MKAALVILVLALAATCTQARSSRELQKTGKFTSGAYCYASASSGAEGRFKNAVVSACAKAVATGCSAKNGRIYVKDLVKEYYKAAEAWVYVWTSAFAQCSTYGNSYGCAQSEAYSKKSQSALVKLFSEAYAKAINSCRHCDPKAKAHVTSELIVALIVKAQAKAKAKVCIGPNKSASARAYADCTAQVLAHGFAKATAIAMINGGCTDLDAEAIAWVKNEVEYDANCFCDSWTCACASNDPRDCQTCNWRFALRLPKTPNPDARAWAVAKCKAYAKDITGK